MALRIALIIAVSGWTTLRDPFLRHPGCEAGVRARADSLSAPRLSIRGCTSMSQYVVPGRLTQTMNILTYTSIFPNASLRQLGVFIFQRMAHVARRTGNTVRVVSPVP